MFYKDSEREGCTNPLMGNDWIKHKHLVDYLC